MSSCSHVIILGSSGDDLSILLEKESLSLPSFDLSKVKIEEKLESINQSFNISLTQKSLFTLSIRQSGDGFCDPTYLCWISKKEDIKKYRWISLLNLSHLEGNQGAVLCEALGLFYKGMPTSVLALSKIELPDLFKAKGREDEFFFYGGSFNPWHQGHQECVNQTYDQFHKSISIIPDKNPLKEFQKKSCSYASFLELSNRFLNTPHWVYPGFVGLDQKNPTVDWITKVSSPSMIIGDDNFMIIEKWKDYHRLLTHLKRVIVIPRCFSMNEIFEKKELLQGLFPDLEILLLNQHSYQELSSRNLRLS